MHFKLTLYYYKLSIHIANPLKKQVKENYPDLYEVVRTVCDKFREIAPFPISDGEIIYITMHFGGHLKQDRRDFTARSGFWSCAQAGLQHLRC